MIRRGLLLLLASMTLAGCIFAGSSDDPCKMQGSAIAEFERQIALKSAAAQGYDPCGPGVSPASIGAAGSDACTTCLEGSCSAEITAWADGEGDGDAFDAARTCADAHCTEACDL